MILSLLQGSVNTSELLFNMDRQILLTSGFYHDLCDKTMVKAQTGTWLGRVLVRCVVIAIDTTFLKKNTMFWLDLSEQMWEKNHHRGECGTFIWVYSGLCNSWECYQALMLVHLCFALGTGASLRCMSEHTPLHHTHRIQNRAMDILSNTKPTAVAERRFGGVEADRELWQCMDCTIHSLLLSTNSKYMNSCETIYSQNGFFRLFLNSNFKFFLNTLPW